MQDPTKNLIDWKTNAWKDPNMVAWYSKRMVENTGTNVLKNLLETRLLMRLVTGHDVLDVGIGTGRGSIPLAKAGYNVSGIDSSQAMLDETQRLAGNIPMNLQVGDVQAVPHADESFDFLLSLNVMVHFPHWQNVLTEWKRVMRPGGRIIFDIHSFDHLQAAHGDNAQAVADIGKQEQTFGSYMATASVEDICRWASANGMTLSAIIPVGVLFGGAAYNHLLAGLESRRDWQRLLSWLPNDRSLLDLALWLEEGWIAHMSSRISGRFFVVLEKVDNPAHNDAWLSRNQALNQLLQQTESVADIAAAVGIDLPSWHQKLRPLLRQVRCRAYLYLIYREVRRLRPTLDVAPLLPPEFAQLFDDWFLQDAIDERSLDWIRNWQRSPEFAGAFQFAGVPLAPGLEYGLMEMILTQYFGVYSGVRS